jgi:hypothetical protein
MLTTLSEHDLEHHLGVDRPLHRRRLLLELEAVRAAAPPTGSPGPTRYATPGAMWHPSAPGATWRPSPETPTQGTQGTQGIATPLAGNLDAVKAPPIAPPLLPPLPYVPTIRPHTQPLPSIPSRPTPPNAKAQQQLVAPARKAPVLPAAAPALPSTTPTLDVYGRVYDPTCNR